MTVAMWCCAIVLVTPYALVCAVLVCAGWNADVGSTRQSQLWCTSCCARQDIGTTEAGVPATRVASVALEPQ